MLQNSTFHSLNCWVIFNVIAVKTQLVVMSTKSVKVVILGPQGVGKTSLAMRYTGKKFSRSLNPTIGSSYFPFNITIRDTTLLLEIWDTAGQERFRAMAPLYYRNARAALVVYDITSYESFLALKIWVRELLRNVDNSIIVCIVGNKLDLESERGITTSEAEAYAMSINADYFETSALTHTGISEVFSCIANKMTRLNDNKCQSFSYGDSLEYSFADSFAQRNQLNKLDLNSNAKEKAFSCCPHWVILPYIWYGLRIQFINLSNITKWLNLYNNSFIFIDIFTLFST